MTPVGHSLMGLAIGCAMTPREFSRTATCVTLAAFVLLANGPDWPLPSWGHDRYAISHSLFVTAALVTALMGVAALVLRGTPWFSWKLLLTGGMAWFSHLLLDTLYDGRKGLAMFWPLSDARVSLPIPIFHTMQLSPLWSEHNARVFAVEGVVYGAVLAAVLLVRFALEGSRRRRDAP